MDKDFQVRIQEFQSELIELTKKYNVVLSSSIHINDVAKKEVSTEDIDKKEEEKDN